MRVAPPGLERVYRSVCSYGDIGEMLTARRRNFSEDSFYVPDLKNPSRGRQALGKRNPTLLIYLMPPSWRLAPAPAFLGIALPCTSLVFYSNCTNECCSDQTTPLLYSPADLRSRCNDGARPLSTLCLCKNPLSGRAVSLRHRLTY